MPDESVAVVAVAVDLLFDESVVVVVVAAAVDLLFDESVVVVAVADVDLLFDESVVVVAVVAAAAVLLPDESALVKNSTREPEENGVCGNSGEDLPPKVSGLLYV